MILDIFLGGPCDSRSLSFPLSALHGQYPKIYGTFHTICIMLAGEGDFSLYFPLHALWQCLFINLYTLYLYIRGPGASFLNVLTFHF